MAIKSKNSGAYADIVGVSVKTAGTYAAVQGIYAKSGGVYGSVYASAKTFSTTLSSISGATPTSLSAIVSILNGTPSSSITPSITTNRTTDSNTGVAPFGVQFDATGTTCVGVSNPFKNLYYEWNFGDDDSATWSYGTRAGVSKKNRATGAVAAHVFRTPGTKTVTCKITNPLTGDTVTRTVTITVQDPDVVFSGTNTICIGKTAPNPGDPGVPSGASLQAATTWDNVLTIINANPQKRILVKADGATWTVGSGLSLTVAGPGIVGTFGGGAKPIISYSAVNRSAFSASTTFTDWRIMGFESNALALGSGTARNGTRFLNCLDGPNNDSGRYTLLLDNYHHNAATFALLGDDCIVADCDLPTLEGGAGNVGIWCYQRNRIAVLGTNIPDGAGVEMNIRLQGVKKAAINNLTLTCPGGNTTKHTLAIRGWSDASASYAWTGDYTEYVFVSDSVITGPSASGVVQFASQNSTSDERHRYIVFERNYVQDVTNYGVCLTSSMSYSVVRNNLFEAVNGPEYAVVMQNSPALPSNGNAVLPPIDTEAYGNSFYSVSAVGHAGTFVYINSAAATGIQVRNNVVYLPGYTGTKRVVLATGGASYTESNNTPNGNIASVSPQFLATPPTTYAEWRTGAASYASGGGTAVPVYDDFFATRRGTTHSMGGITSYGSSMVASTSDVNVNRADGSVDVEIRLTNAAQTAVTGTINTADITAIAGVDYTAQSGVAFSIPSGSASGTITITILP